MEFDDTFISPEVRAIELEELDEVGPGISAMRRDELVGLVKDGVLHDDVCVCGCVCVGGAAGNCALWFSIACLEVSSSPLQIPAYRQFSQWIPRGLGGINC
jgi:hypothetical protein